MDEPLHVRSLESSVFHGSCHAHFVRVVVQRLQSYKRHHQLMLREPNIDRVLIARTHFAACCATKRGFSARRPLRSTKNEQAPMV